MFRSCILAFDTAKKIIACCMVLLSGYGSICTAAPVINIGSMYDFMEPGRTTLLKRIRNVGENTAFVRVSVSEIVFERNERKEVVIDTNDILKNKGKGLVVSPTRMVIPANGVQLNRLLFVGNRDKERYYRVRFIPVIPKDALEFNLNEKDMENYGYQVNAGIHVLSGYGAIVTVRPDLVRYQTEIKEDREKVIITNNGNTTIILDTLRECRTGLKDRCITPQVKHILPGRNFIKKLSKEQFLQFSLIEGENKKKMVIGNKV